MRLSALAADNPPRRIEPAQATLLLVAIRVRPARCGRLGAADQVWPTRAAHQFSGGLMSDNFVCWNCGASLASEPLPLSRHANCERCFTELHCCRHCAFYDPTAVDACTDDRADPPVNKEGANFCEFFKPGTDAYAGQSLRQISTPRAPSSMPCLAALTMRPEHRCAHARPSPPMKRWLAATVLRLSGWTLHGNAPDLRQCVVIAAPHTSNWDFVWMKLAAWALGWEFNWLGKHTLFTGPTGFVMRWWGGIPVDRRANQDLVSQVIARFATGEPLSIAIPAEGTRSESANWKSGFYHIARGAQVPIVLSFLDFGTRTTGVGPAIVPSGDVGADMDKIRAYYEPMRGKFPDRSGPIRLQEEAHRDAT